MMVKNEITIKEIDFKTFEVFVRDVDNKAVYLVTVTDSYYKKLTKGEVSKKKLLEYSFKFLLKRESTDSIFPKFKLSIIQKYFPEYESTIKEMLN